jgi:hypothetical protein
MTAPGARMAAVRIWTRVTRTLSTLRIGAALLGDECQDQWPATRTKLLARNTICRNRVEGVESEVVKYSLQALLLSDEGDALDGIKKPPRRFLGQKLLEKTAYNVDPQMRPHRTGTM